jgi:hypothetical protein
MRHPCGVRSIVLLLLLAIVLMVPAPAATSAQDAQSFRFPLWKDVPGRTFAVLAHKSKGEAEWAAFASRGGKSSRSRKRPCITVAIFTRDNRYANAGSCGPLAPEAGLRHPPIHPLIGGSTGSYFAMSFTRQVIRVDLELQSGAHIGPRVTPLSRRQAQKSHLARFHYVARSFARDTCIQAIKGYSADGTLIVDANTDEC